MVAILFAFVNNSSSAIRLSLQAKSPHYVSGPL
jgi:hypothetical protein